MHKLSERAVRAASVPGYYGDGGGLWLQVSASGSKSWIFRFTLAGKAREMGLGSFNARSLLQAREKAREARELLADGTDPIEAKRDTGREQLIANARRVTFKVDAEACIEAKRPEWKNAKHADQWTNTLDTYAYPFIGNMLVDEIDTPDVMRCLQPIWTTKTETATRVRSRIETVLDYASALKHRSGDNPARWRGNLDSLLPNPAKVAKVENHAALPYADMGAFMALLRHQQGTSAALLEFIILTAVRTSEAAGAQWDEFDLDGKTWTIPGARMKAGREHRVPLSAAAVKVMRRMETIRESEFVFPGMRDGKPLSNMACLTLLKRMKRTDITTHGFRSAFRDWAAETTNHPREVAEMALAHAIESKVEAAYRRGDLFEKRRKLMDAWATHCGRLPAALATVTPIRKKRT